MYLIRGSRDASSWTTVAVLSVDPSFTTINSQFEYVWASTDSIDAAIYFSALYAGMMILTRSSDIELKCRCFAISDPTGPFRGPIGGRCIEIPNRAHAALWSSRI